MKKRLTVLLLASSMLLSGCVNIHPNNVSSETENITTQEITTQESVEQPAPEVQLRESVGLEFRSAENNTCYVTGIGNCTDSELVIPATSPKGEIVVGIAEDAFYGTWFVPIRSVTLPDTVKSIGDRAFQRCSRLRSVELNQVETIGEFAFSECDLFSFRIPKSVKRIGRAAFSNNENIVSVSVESGNLYYSYVGSVGEPASYLIEEETGTLIFGVLCGNVSLRDDSITKIGDYAFSSCESLKSLDISQLTIREIGNYAFKMCTSMQSIRLPENLETMGKGVFSNCLELKQVEIPEQVIFSNGTDGLFSGCSSLESVKLPANIEQIGDYCFTFCESLKSFVIPSSVTQIGKSVFARCPRLDSLTVDAGNTTFLSKDGCVIERSTKTLVAMTPRAQIPSDGSVEVLGDGVLCGQDRTEIIVPEGVKQIGKEAFEANDHLEFISIPHSVEIIDENAFANCWSTETISYGGTVDEWKQLMPNDSWMTWTKKFTIRCTDGEVYIYCDNPAKG